MDADGGGCNQAAHMLINLLACAGVGAAPVDVVGPANVCHIKHEHMCNEQRATFTCTCACTRSTCTYTCDMPHSPGVDGVGVLAGRGGVAVSLSLLCETAAVGVDVSTHVTCTCACEHV